MIVRTSAPRMASNQRNVTGTADKTMGHERKTLCGTFFVQHLHQSRKQVQYDIAVLHHDSNTGARRPQAMPSKGNTAWCSDLSDQSWSPVLNERKVRCRSGRSDLSPEGERAHIADEWRHSDAGLSDAEPRCVFTASRSQKMRLEKIKGLIWIILRKRY